jgi:DNA polymerase-3 subunit alpha
LGVYVSGHPLDRFREKLERANANIARTKANARPGIEIIVAGIVEEAREIMTKSGEKMAFLKVADMTDSLEVTASRWSRSPAFSKIMSRSCAPKNA